MYSQGCAPIHEVYGRVRRFCLVPFRQVHLIHHSPCDFYYVLVFTLNNVVLLRCVTAWEFLSDYFLSKIHRKIIRKIFFTSIWSNEQYVPTCSFFDLGFEPLDVSEHFSLLSHKIDPGGPGEVFDEHDIIMTSAECGYLGRPPYTWMYNIRDPFAHIPLLWKWRSDLTLRPFANMANFTSVDEKINM